MKEPLISIIIPVYNAKENLNFCMNGILQQTYHNYEVILIDDGSIDGSDALCDEYAKKYENIICIHQSNQGVSSARNAGLEEANGDLIAFCDSDDMYMPDMLNKLYKLMQQYDTDLTVCSYVKSNSRLSLRQDISQDHEPLIIDRHKAIDKIISSSNGYLWNKLFKRELIASLRFSEEIAILEDELFVIQYLYKCTKVAFTDEKLYLYVDNPNSAVNAEISNRRLTDIIARERILELLIVNGSDVTLREMIWNNLLRSYAITLKKIIISQRKELTHWKNYIKQGYLNYKKMFKLDASWSVKEKVYLTFLKVYCRF